MKFGLGYYYLFNLSFLAQLLHRNSNNKAIKKCCLFYELD